MFLEQNTQPPRPTQAPQHGTDGFERRASFFQPQGDHVREDLRIRFADAFNTACSQAFPELLEILDDAVVDQMDPIIVGWVRVRVDLRHASVGGPAGVSDAEGSGNVFWKDGFQVGYLSNRLVSLDGAVVLHRDAR